MGKLMKAIVKEELKRVKTSDAVMFMEPVPSIEKIEPREAEFLMIFRPLIVATPWKAELKVKRPLPTPRRSRTCWRLSSIRRLVMTTDWTS
jgi:hypothetical protein